MKKYNVKVRYIFEGTYDVVADSREQAKAIAERDCGLVMGSSIHTSNDGNVVDWDFSMHPEAKILSVKPVKTA